MAVDINILGGTLEHLSAFRRVQVTNELTLVDVQTIESFPDRIEIVFGSKMGAAPTPVSGLPPSVQMTGASTTDLKVTIDTEPSGTPKRIVAFYG